MTAYDANISHITQPLYHRLTVAAQQERKLLSQLIRDLLTETLAGQEKAQLKHTYAA